MIFLVPLAFILTLSLIPLACRVAVVTGYVDQPGGRKKHTDAIPPVGGIVIFTVFITLSWFSGISIASSIPYYAALTLLLATGFVDDRWPLPPLVKLFMHIAAASIVVIGGNAKLIGLGTLLGPTPFELGALATPFSILCVVFLINAINMIDGVDGLAGGISLMTVGWLLAYSITDGDGATFTTLSILAACLLGFLWHNMRTPLRKQARVFMGDAGSMALGLSIAWFCINMTNDPLSSISPVFIAWLVAVPCMDAFGLFIMRLSEGRHPFSADRRHFHHHFQRSAGFSAGQTTVIILAYSFTLAMVGYIGTRALPDYIMGWAWIVLLAAHTTMVLLPNKFITFLKKARLLARKTLPVSCAEGQSEDRMAA